MAGGSPTNDLTFLGSNRRLARAARNANKFLAVEASGGIVLLIATAAALIWVNSPWSDSYHHFWETEIALEIGSYSFHEELEAFVNDALMALFFFVVGLEIKRELVVGQLKNPRDAALPAIAALGGMVVPALFYVVFNAGGEGVDGWGIPMATDIAFAVGILSLLGSRVPRTLKVFLLTLAIVDDIGAIIVIALFYTDDLSTGWLLIAGLLVVAIGVMRKLNVWYTPLYVIAGFLLWGATFESGVHATIAGVVLGLMTPAKPILSEEEAVRLAQEVQADENLEPEEIQAAAWSLRESSSVATRLEHALHPWTSFLIIPLFALANAGVELSGDSISNATTSPITLGIIAGLIVGKTVGITGAAYLAVKLGVSKLPKVMSMGHVFGVSMVAGIGFTVSLFITKLAFTADGQEHIVDEAKIGILVASFLASVLGLLIMMRVKPTGVMTPEEHAAALVED